MSRKKGLSAEEKKEKMRQLFLDSQDVYTGKEVEKLAPKIIGINSMIVKDVLQQTCDEGWVNQEKIGISNYFWAFRSQDINKKRVRATELEAEVVAAKKKKEDLKQKLQTMEAGRETTPERTEQLKKLADLRKRNAEVKDKLQKYAQNDPDWIKALEQGAQIAMDAANRWTDNIFTMRSWFADTLHVETADFNRNFEVPDEIDYVAL